MTLEPNSSFLAGSGTQFFFLSDVFFSFTKSLFYIIIHLVQKYIKKTFNSSINSCISNLSCLYLKPLCSSTENERSAKHYMFQNGGYLLLTERRESTFFVYLLKKKKHNNILFQAPRSKIFAKVPVASESSLGK